MMIALITMTLAILLTVIAGALFKFIHVDGVYFNQSQDRLLNYLVLFGTIAWLVSIIAKAQ